MRKILNFLLNVFELPIVFPIMTIYQLYVVFMIVKQSNQADLYGIDADELGKIIEPHTDNFFNKYKYFMYAFSIIFWLQLIKYIILQIYGI
jgi:hypothetical protein